jgi:dihydrofolate reductase
MTHPFEQPTNTTSPAVHDPAMPSTSPCTLPLTLILAATPKLGIGQAGTLPWPQLKLEMAYFARVTKRLRWPHTLSQAKRINAVIMGRKTWDSIPDRFRPLKGRLNVVVTRDPDAERWQGLQKNAEEGPVVVGGLTQALEALQSQSQPSDTLDETASPSPTYDEHALEIDRVFVIGGASLYAAALELPQTDRVLLTKIHKEYDCDTFFPVDLDGREGANAGWRKASQEALRKYVGEEVGELVEEKDVSFEFCLYQRS